MPNRNKHTAMLIAALGIGILGAASLYAEPSRDVGQVEPSGNADSRVRNTEITGGFYEDRYKLDDWYYDFYDSPRSVRMSSAALDQRYDDETVDAAHPSLNRETAHRSESREAERQYYNESWFYIERDPIYGMPEWTGFEQPGGNVIKGTIKATKQVRNRTTGGQNTVVLLTTADRRQITVDLGSSRRTMDLALTPGDLIQVAGPWEDVGPYSVLMAHQIKTEAKRMTLYRPGKSNTLERKVEGRIQQFRDIRTSRGTELHRTAAVQTPDGRIALVDLGSDSQAQSLTRASTGDRMVAHGRVIQVGNYPVLLANRVAINDGTPVQVDRPADSAEFSPGTGRPVENCLGAGCDNQPLHQGQPTMPHSNSTDGTMR